MSPVARVTLVAALVIGAFAMLVTTLPAPGEESIHPFNDVYDRDVYYQRGSWLPRHAVPFLEVHSEYPELATWFFALPYLVIDAPADPDAYVKSPRPERYLPVFERYIDLHSLEMAACLLLLVYVSA